MKPWRDAFIGVGIIVGSAILAVAIAAPGGPVGVAAVAWRAAVMGWQAIIG
jgi:hypothetical protein